MRSLHGLGLLLLPLVLLSGVVLVDGVMFPDVPESLQAAPSDRGTKTSQALPDTLDLSKIYGRIQFVEHFPDYKVQVVEHFPDLRVQRVDNFPDAPGKWQIVDHFPDYKIQLVEHFPDFTIKYVDHFPGVE